MIHRDSLDTCNLFKKVKLDISPLVAEISREVYMLELQAYTSIDASTSSEIA